MSIQGEQPPDTHDDRIHRRKLAALLGIVPQAASAWAHAGRLRRYEHGVVNCGRRRYSRALVQRELLRCCRQSLSERDDVIARLDT